MNKLISETSPYLLQHAHNPVNWYPWGEEALSKAKAENKLLLVSIGYSSCHWCHVMEHESFEDTAVARVMNTYFVCIKVDREERPDIDQVYMDACQLITGRGGWPLNAFALPDGRPVHAGTYFPKERWTKTCLELAQMFERDPDEMEEYADQLEKGIVQMNKLNLPKEESEGELSDLAWKSVSRNFDKRYGGYGGAPKFPMPSIFKFLSSYAILNNNDEARQQLNFSLEQIAAGGIYDQIGGGFARYSTDAMWKVPHFEKMLYDNAQLLSVYAKAYKQSNNELFRRVLEETIQWLKREMMGEKGQFYSALDADSEGEEGKFYVWTSAELKNSLTDKEMQLVLEHYAIDEKSLWEHNNNVLMSWQSEEISARHLNLRLEEFRERLKTIKTKLLKKRAERIRPGLDDKAILSWNAMTTIGLLDAYDALGEDDYLELAKQNLNFLLDEMYTDDGLLRTYNKEQARIRAFAEDYAFLISALIEMYQRTFDEVYLRKAEKLMIEADSKFRDEESPMYFFKSKHEVVLLTRKFELSDNVIPSHNSVMAENLFALGQMLGKEEWIEQARTMIGYVHDQLDRNANYYANWASLKNKIENEPKEVVICGKEALSVLKKLRKENLPSVIFAGTQGSTDEYPHILKNRIPKEGTLIYVCENRACKLPVRTANEALLLMR